MSGYRQTLKRIAPSFVKPALHGLRARLAGPELDEVMLNDFQFAADDDPTPRLNLIIPSLAKARAFGGVTTGVEIFVALATELRKLLALDLRVVLDDFEGVADDNVLRDAVANTSLDGRDIEVVSGRDKHRPLATRANDFFVTFNFYITVNVHRLLARQSEHFRCARRPVIYLIQDYEPHMFPFSSTQMVARQAYDAEWPLWGVFNSSELFRYFEHMGHEAEKAYVFEPTINPRLKPHLAGLRDSAKRKRILVYGRPNVKRNCFSALVRGLARWAENHPEFADWEVVSAGTAHNPISLPGGRKVRPVGKLSLDAYGAMLRETAVGVSLMASPHPSYPPLEMAHFGIRTITNLYTGKDLSQAHDNIRSVATLDPDALAAAIAQACRDFEADPEGGARASSHLPAYLDVERPFPFARQLASDVRGLIV